MAVCHQFLLIQVALKVSHVKKCLIDTNINKNVFQWDAYRPLVDRIPTCTWQEGGDGVCISQHALDRGCLPRCPGGVYPGEVSARGVSAWGSAQGRVSA